MDCVQKNIDTFDEKCQEIIIEGRGVKNIPNINREVKNDIKILKKDLNKKIDNLNSNTKQEAEKVLEDLK